VTWAAISETGGAARATAPGHGDARLTRDTAAAQARPASQHRVSARESRNTAGEPGSQGRLPRFRFHLVASISLVDRETPGLDDTQPSDVTLPSLLQIARSATDSGSSPNGRFDGL
jgi:hypothetical protein